MKHLQRLAVDFNDLVLVGNVDEYAALAVGHHELWLPAKWYCSGNRALGRINGGRTRAGTVHDENALGDRFIRKGIRSLARLYRSDFLRGLEINDHNLALVFIGDKAAAKLRHRQ